MPKGLSPFSPQPLYPSKDSLAEAVAHASAQLPIQSVNELMPLLMTYHNTLLHEQSQQKDTVQ